MRAGVRVFDELARWTGLTRASGSRIRRGLTILMYHRVLPRDEADGYPLRNLVICREDFERQVRWLARRARIVTVRDGVGLLREGELGGSGPTVAFTFDDGYGDNARAAEILEASGVRGTFFVTSGFIAGRSFWFDRASEYLRRLRGGLAGPPKDGTPAGEAAGHVATLDGWLGWLKSLTRVRREEVLEALGATAVPSGCEPMRVAELAAMARAGHEIAGHTATHPVLTAEPMESVREELESSKRQIEAWIGGPVTGFCYPNGSWSEGVRQACLDAGYTYATTTRRHINTPGQDAMTLGRRWISPDNSTGLRGGHSGAVFGAEVLGLHDLFRARVRRARGPGGAPPAPPSRPLTRAA